ncbi:MAG: UDP-N-acetylmuramate dehydrogenase [Bacteroidetes bacterium]|nr:UDP-N-acetylmuramate dehydrogenase [Bacteroidota bacterium]
MIQSNISLKDYNTFGLDITASSFCVVKSKTEIINLIQNEFSKYAKKLFLGGGSNILFLKDYEGLVIKNEIKGIEIERETDEYVYLKSYSGTQWHDLVLYCVDKNLGGIENLSLIPGTVGAAPMQNIGAYGVEIKDVFEALEAIDLTTGETIIFTNKDCQFGYRESIFKNQQKNKFFIYSVTFRLNKKPILNLNYGDIQKKLIENECKTPTIKEVSNAIIEIRNSKLPNPKEIGNAGSFFKNPEVSIEKYSELFLLFPSMPKYDLPNGNVKIPAAWLIEQCGFKGKKYGNTGNHAKQALVIVNYGNASGIEIYNHAILVQKEVEIKFGILLSAEVNFI